MSAEDNRVTDSSATADPSATAESPSFNVAMQELESILERIDGDGIDLDQLATELRRATELLELCRGKIRKADVEVALVASMIEGIRFSVDRAAERRPSRACDVSPQSRRALKFFKRSC